MKGKYYPTIEMMTNIKTVTHIIGIAVRLAVDKDVACSAKNILISC
jgi:hypothetical protein